MTTLLFSILILFLIILECYGVISLHVLLKDSNCCYRPNLCRIVLLLLGFFNLVNKIVQNSVGICINNKQEGKD
jgi:hypothetical protein